MGKKTSAPPAPNFTQAAEQTAAANRVNQVTPYGSLTWEQSQPTFDQAGYDAAMLAYNNQNKNISNKSYLNLSPQEKMNFTSGGGMQAPDRSKFMTGGGQWTQKVTLSPEQQALLDQQNKTSIGLANLQGGMLGQVQNAMNQPAISMKDLPTIQADYGKTGFDAIMSRLNPQLEQQRQAFATQMANQGINLGSEAYNNAFRNQSQAENDARTQAALQGIGIGMQQQNQQMDLQNQQFGLLSAMRDRPLNQLNALRAGSQVTNPTFAATTPGADYMNAANMQNQYNMGLYNSKVANKNNMMGGLFGLGSSLISGGFF